LKVYARHTNDDRFWALALAAYASEKTAPLPSKPRAYTA
jgi:hypothetical protein